jgi:hypothetical protein
MFWLKKTENAITVAQMAKSQPIAIIAIMIASPGWHRAESTTCANFAFPFFDLRAISLEQSSHSQGTHYWLFVAGCFATGFFAAGFFSVPSPISSKPT